MTIHRVSLALSIMACARSGVIDQARTIKSTSGEFNASGGQAKHSSRPANSKDDKLAVE